MRIKICGITQPEQGVAIAQLAMAQFGGAGQGFAQGQSHGTPGLMPSKTPSKTLGKTPSLTPSLTPNLTLGFIAVPTSPRYVAPEQMRAIGEALDKAGYPVAKVGVFADADLERIVATVAVGGLTGVQLHGGESVDFCRQLGDRLAARFGAGVGAGFGAAGFGAQVRAQEPKPAPSSGPGIELWKAVRVRSAADLDRALTYEPVVQGLLLDAYHPQQLGGTGVVLDWALVQDFRPGVPWFLAGGLHPGNVREAVQRLGPDGVDLSSGVERGPGDKDLEKVAALFAALAELAADLND